MSFQRKSIVTFYLLVASADAFEHFSTDNGRNPDRGSVRGCGRNRRRTTKKVTWHQFQSDEEKAASELLETISSDIQWREVDNEPAVELNLHSIQEIISQQQYTADTNHTDAPPTPLLRIESASFSDGTHSMYNGTLPNPRAISNAFHTNHSIPNTNWASDWLWTFGQFLNHDLSEVNVNNTETCDIEVSPSDLYLHNVTIIPMSRSKFTLDGMNVAQQMKYVH